MALRNPLVLAPLAISLIGGSIQLSSGCAATESNTFTGGAGGKGSTTSTTSGQGGDIPLFDAGQGGGMSSSGGVPQTCAEALMNKSYIGCEYWPTVTSNSLLFDQFKFAIAAANPTTTDAVVTVERAGAMIKQVTVTPGQLQTIELPWVDELKGVDAVGDGSGLGSILSKKGAYKVTSSVPVTVYQFNPLEFELKPAPANCPQPDEQGRCFSFSNDASLLLPKTALSGEYFVVGYPTMHLGVVDPLFGTTQWINSPGFVTITATEDGTNVTFDSSANVRTGPGVAKVSVGGSATYKLDAGDVLQLLSGAGPAGKTPQTGKPCVDDFVQGVTYCPSPPSLDFTGSHINADKPISVIAGHDCTFVPYDAFACDHIEESLFPLDTLGNSLIVTAPLKVSSVGAVPGEPDNMYVRVISATNGNAITFDPPVSPPVTLDAGKWIEIGPVTQDFQVKAKDKVLVGQYMIGENYGGGQATAGDPSLSIAIPTEQYRVEYSFLAPTTYTYNIVNVVTATGSNISIDGVAIPSAEFTPIGGTGMSVARHAISGGTHRMVGNANFGIVVYGYGSYTSYMYPGGLNLEKIIIVPQ